jgi:hypothetical protein
MSAVLTIAIIMAALAEPIGRIYNDHIFWRQVRRNG